MAAYTSEVMEPKRVRSNESSRNIAIVGGGLAGLAAAAELGRAGLQVTLFEARRRLGGRATSFDDKQTGELVDNCQHVGMGCCTNLQKFCDDVGVSDLFHIERSLSFVDRRGEISEFAANKLPAPFHLASAFAGLKYFSWGEKWTLAGGFRRLAAERRFDGSFLDWLVFDGQPERVRRLFWHVVLVSALSDTLDRVSTQTARKVFVDGFMRHRHAWEVHLPKAPLDDLYGPPVTKTLSERGVRLRMNTSVAALSESESGWTLATRDGEGANFDTVVLAVPYHRLEGLLPESIASRSEFAAAGQLEPAPIASVHLWLDRPITDLPHAVFVDHLSQWMFRRPSGETGLHYYQVVISASRELEGLPRDDVIAEVKAELASVFPAADDAELRHARVVVEKRAVFSPTPESHSARSPQRTSVPRLYLAGDWTDTGWPATMEGAVRSGYLAAEAVLEDAGQVLPLVAADLPASLVTRLMRWA